MRYARPDRCRSAALLASCRTGSTALCNTLRVAVALVVAVPILTTGRAAAQGHGAGAPELRIAQDTTVVQEITLRDGSTLMGRVIAIEDDRITIRTVSGLEIVVDRGDIVSVRDVRGVRHGDEFWLEDPSDSRLFLGPTGRVAGRGRGYFGLYEVFFGSVAVGLGSGAMISGGFSLLPGTSISDQVFYVAPKVQVVNTRPVQAAVGVFWVKPGTGNESGGLAFATVTAGTERAAVTGGVGFPFFSREGFTDEQVLIVGAEVRATRSVKFITENWVAPGEDEALLSGGVRLILSRVTVELAGVTSTDGEFLLPLVSVSLIW